MLTEENIVNIDKKLRLVGLVVLQALEIDRLNYIDTIITSVCDEWEVVRHITKARRASGACSDNSVFYLINKLAKHDGCNTSNKIPDSTPVNNNSFLIGVGFDYGKNC